MNSSRCGTPESMINVHIDNREIIDSQANVGVSTVHRSGNLLVGKLASRVLEAAGDEMQKEVYSQMSHSEKPLELGKVLTVEPRALGDRFQSFMLICLEPWRNEKDELPLLNGVYECLDLSSRRGYTSITIPALGMGGLRYPPQAVALAMAQAICRFGANDAHYPNVKTVYISIWEVNSDITKTFLKTFIGYLKGDLDDSGENVSRKSTFWANFGRFFTLPWRAAPESPAAVNTGNQSGNAQLSTAASGNHASNAPTVNIRGPPSFTLENTAWRVKLAHIDADLEKLLGVWLKLQVE